MAISLDQIYNGIWANESGRSSSPGVWGDNGQAAGVMQVHQAALDDVNAAQGTNYTQAQIAANPALGQQVGQAYARMQYQRFGGDPMLTFAAYNAGPGAVQSWINGGRQGPMPGAAYAQAALRRAQATSAGQNLGQAQAPMQAMGPASGASPAQALGASAPWTPPSADPQGSPSVINAMFKNALLQSALKSFRVPVQLIQVDYNPFLAATQQGLNGTKGG